MSRDKIKKDYLNKIGQITKLNEKYYNDNNSPASDSYYDTLKKEVIELENKYKFLNHKDSPSKIVGF